MNMRRTFPECPHEQHENDSYKKQAIFAFANRLIRQHEAQKEEPGDHYRRQPGAIHAPKELKLHIDIGMFHGCCYGMWWRYISDRASWVKPLGTAIVLDVG